MERANAPTAPADVPAPARHELQPLPGLAYHCGPALDAAFSEAVWNAAIRVYINTRPALN